VTPPPAAVGT
jgi:hypothetical protein